MSSGAEKLPVAVGITATAEVLERFVTVAEAEAWLERREKIDPDGVLGGAYFLDAPEEASHE